ncbi:thioredoxin [Corynebacterium yudongzhengii]|uniref:Thioredoxin n=1 Tax=Corynebacterium yudongzhengii TaxID=2080740 RepID=A0A2U1T4I7_9CORY|nr:thioredoxin [Corynebacterium yudongzhengii]AWB82879.1 thioredoxin [Corynebacterium yudongzhengii]PWC00926.1 thioredoxin [Corynebacterium yudongzhengii]
MTPPVEVTQDNFRSTVIESDKPVLVDFWAEWCGPCKKLSPVIDEISEELGDKVTVAKVDVDAQRMLGAMYQVMSIPTVMLFKDGEKVDEFQGVRPKEEIVDMISSQL